MMKLKDKWKQSGSFRMLVIIVATFTIMLCSSIFIGNEMVQNRVYYLRSCEEEISLTVSVLKDQVLEQLESQGLNGTIEWMERNGIGTGSRWQLLEKDGRVCYLKNKAYTSEAMEKINKEKKSIRALIGMQGKIISKRFELDGHYYTYGLLVDEGELLQQGSVNKHMVYLLLVFGALEWILFCAVILLVRKLNGLYEKNQLLNKQLVETQLKVELTNEESEQALQKMREHTGEEWMSPYDKDLLYAILEKSDQKELRPMHILEIKLTLANRYYSKQEIQDFIGKLSQHLGKQDIFLEVAKGEFVILMYCAVQEQAQKLRERISTSWAPLLQKEGIGVYMGLSYVEEGEKAKETYEKLKENMKYEVVA